MKESDLLLARIRSAVMTLNPPAGYSETPVAGLALSRHASAGEQCCCPGEPGVTLILSGVKVSQVGASVLRFRAGEALLAGAAVPTVYSFEGVSESAPAGSIVRAVGWLRAHFAKPVAIEELARSFGMSVSSFHRQFKAVTGMSPLQYQKQLRLIEAQRLMLSSRTQVAEAAYAVGYESPTQFVREYKRQFGLPPLRDIRERRRRIAAGESIEGVGPAAQVTA